MELSDARHYGMVPGGRWTVVAGAVFFGAIGLISAIFTATSGGLVPSMLLFGAGVVCAWLHWASSSLTYELREEGLLIHRPGKDVLARWPSITGIRWSRSLHTMWIKREDGNWSFLSTDLFPGLPNFVAAIADRSGCDLGKNVREVLDDLRTGKRDWTWWPDSLRTVPFKTPAG